MTLRQEVKDWLDGAVEENYSKKELLENLSEYGCASGMVGDLIYYHDTTAFFQKHKTEINALLSEVIDDCGYSTKGTAGLFGDKWDSKDPLAKDTHNQNLLAWFAFEQTAQRILDHE